MQTTSQLTTDSITNSITDSQNSTDTSDDVSESIDIDDKLKKKMLESYEYPNPIDPDFQSKIYKKREYHGHKIQGRSKLNTYDDVKKRRHEVCSGKFQLREQQAFLGNYINPNTPNDGVLIFHGTGTGKTCAAITIAETFKHQIQKYESKIYVLTPGPLIKENWINEILKCTGEAYMKKTSSEIYETEEEQNRNRKIAVANIKQYYHFISYKSFYKKVMGEKIKDYIAEDDEQSDKNKKTYKKTETGEFERDIALDRIHNLDNSLLIVDEAHNLTGNYYGQSLMEMKKKSKNLKIVLLTATPMKNLASDIIELINFVRPFDKPMMRDMIFTHQKNYNMDFKQGGLEYLRKMCNGYVSYLRGADPITFAKRTEKGEVPAGLLFTKVIRCFMNKFQLDEYNNTIKNSNADGLDTITQSASNMVFPGVDNTTVALKGFSGISGISNVKNQLGLYSDKINKLVANEILGIEYNESKEELVRIGELSKNISGGFMSINNLKHFSTKFHQALTNLNRLVDSDKGAKTAFIYSNLVVTGIDIFKEVLIQHGYLEFEEDSNRYLIKDNTICYLCGLKYKDHNQEIHQFNPATFFVVTGTASEEGEAVIPADKQKILNKTFSNIKNKDGKYIKFVLGSPVMTEGISLKNVSEVHILDSGYTLGKTDQIIGRAIRYCSHYDLINDKNRYPEVEVYKYVVSIDPNKPTILSNEEELYRKAERKYITVKKVERVLKEIAIDCPLNRHGNIFPEEADEFKNCNEPTKQQKDGVPMCPSICDYTGCDFKCSSNELNRLYYDEKTNTYKNIGRETLDYSTFSNEFARSEIELVKSKIKEMYKLNYVYVLGDIMKYVKESYPDDKKYLFDEYFCFKALDELTPQTENDFNNLTSTIQDKYNRSGYLIHLKKYYIFQLFEQPENTPMHYRTTFDKSLSSQFTLNNYLKTTHLKSAITESTDKDEILYDYDMDYYGKRPEYSYVGIIDGQLNKDTGKEDELFKVRKGLNDKDKQESKKRGKGITTFKGTVCSFKNKEKTGEILKLLDGVSKSLGMNVGSKDSIKGKFKKSKSIDKDTLCNNIKERLLFLEKYGSDSSTSSIKKKTYLIVPVDHPVYEFPYNLEDRLDFIKNKLDDIGKKFDMKIDTKQESKFNVKVKTFKITIKETNNISNQSDSKALSELGFSKKDGKWILEVA